MLCSQHGIVTYFQVSLIRTNISQIHSDSAKIPVIGLFRGPFLTSCGSNCVWIEKWLELGFGKKRASQPDNPTGLTSRLVIYFQVNLVQTNRLDHLLNDKQQLNRNLHVQTTTKSETGNWIGSQSGNWIGNWKGNRQMDWPPVVGNQQLAAKFTSQCNEFMYLQWSIYIYIYLVLLETLTAGTVRNASMMDSKKISRTEIFRNKLRHVRTRTAIYVRKYH